MNLGDGLKLESELLDGKTKLILSPYEHKSKISVKLTVPICCTSSPSGDTGTKPRTSHVMGNKTKIAKCPLRTEQTAQILKSTQNTCFSDEKLLRKKKIGSETSLIKGEKNRMTFLSTKDLCKKFADKDCLYIQKGISPATPNIQKTRNTVNTSVVTTQKTCNNHITAENMKSSLVCLTEDQLQQILMSVNQENRSTSLIENGKEEETSLYNLHLNDIPNQPKDENIMGLLQETEAVLSIPDENKSVLNKKQGTSKQYEQKITIENVWKPADIFSTLGERERDRNLLEAKKAQWRKELDEQVALKKKEKEASEQRSNNHWKKSESDKIVWEKLQILDQYRGDEHDRWAVHFDSFYPGSQSQLSSRSAHKQPEYFCVSPDTQELTDISNVYIPTTGSQVEPSQEEHITKPVRDLTVANSEKTNFLRSMTALLDPAQIEERDRRRQKQLEHQKAITAQVEEKRRKKQLEKEQRKKEEEEEECRLAREREEMQKQYEEDILRQKQKEEIMTLKTNELFQTMQRAQELAQRLKQEQRIRELTQKGHDTSRLIKNLGVDIIQMEYNAPTNNISNSVHDSDEISGKLNTCISSTTSPKKDAGVQTDNLNTGIITNEESHYASLKEMIDHPSPEISAEFNGQVKKNKQQLNQIKGANIEKEDNWYNDHCNQFTRTEKQTKHMKKCLKKPDWNINKPLKRYIPASEKYPKQLQKQREEKKLRRQMELLHLLERNNPGHFSQNRGTSPQVVHSSNQETESRCTWHLVKKEEESSKVNSFIKERSQSPQIPAVKNRTQQTQTNTSYFPLKNISCERENLISGGSHTELSPGISEPSPFIPYVRTNEIYYLDPEAPLSTQNPGYKNSLDCDQEQQQLCDSDHFRDPLLNPKLVKNRDRQQAILKGLSELRQGLLQKQKELETNLMPLAANQEENFSSSL
ncbi:coiled-coil domain-containing protein 66 isoform X4 [Dasypus novemcinctus]|uniref:coiled-coil domain-containing protein 66 isoform X4 n=1 Tax=Dasypus novemcinctus TaxID=9361 RepID=UPI00265FFE50|nr:coiled-coil domain-containing protein 66 isoform X4 [Dasypus novemcinctus]